MYHANTSARILICFELAWMNWICTTLKWSSIYHPPRSSALTSDLLLMSTIRTFLALLSGQSFVTTQLCSPNTGWEDLHNTFQGWTKAMVCSTLWRSCNVIWKLTQIINYCMHRPITCTRRCDVHQLLCDVCSFVAWYGQLSWKLQVSSYLVEWHPISPAPVFMEGRVIHLV